MDFELKQIVAYDSLPEAGRKLDCSRALRAVHRFVSATFTFRRSKRASTGLGGSRHTCASATKVGLTVTTAASSLTLPGAVVPRATRHHLSLAGCGASKSGSAPVLASRVTRWREQLVLWLRTGKVPGREARVQVRFLYHNTFYLDMFVFR